MKRSLFERRFAVLCALAGGMSTSLTAATYTWTGAGFLGSKDYLWSNPFNWSGNVAPAASDTQIILVFPDTAAPRTTTNDLGALNVQGITFNGAGYTIGGLGNRPSIVMSGSRAVTPSIKANADNCRIASSCPLSVDATTTVQVANTRLLTLASTISGPGGLRKTGLGDVRMAAAGNNTYEGTTTVDEGQLLLDQRTVFPVANTFVAIPGPLVVGGNDFNFQARVRLDADNQIADSAPITVNESGRLSLNTHDDTLGPITSVGALIDTEALPGFSGNPGLLTFNGNVTNLPTPLKFWAAFSGRFSLGLQSRRFQVESNSVLNLVGNISGAGVFAPGITKSGLGQLVLWKGTNNYVGATTVEQGPLRLIGTSQHLGSTAAGTIIHAGGQLQLENSHIGVEPLTLHGGPVPAVTFEGTNSWAGPINLLGVAGIAPDTAFAGPDFLEISGAISGNGALRKLGLGELRLTGNTPNTHSGGTFVDDGQLVLAKPAVVTAVPGPLTVGHLANTVALPLVTLANPGQIGDAANIHLIHRGRLDSVNQSEVVGALEMTGGQLLSSGAAGQWRFNGDISVHHSVQFISKIPARIHLGSVTGKFHIDEFATLDVGGVISGTGSAGISKDGKGSMNLLAPNTYPGGTHALDGVLGLVGKGQPGNTGAGVNIAPQSILRLENASIGNEVLTLNGGGPVAFSLYAKGSNVWSGPVQLIGNPVIQLADEDSSIDFGGQILGNSDLLIQGAGMAFLSGPAANIHTGRTVLHSGRLLLAKTGASAIPGELVIGRVETNAPEAEVICMLPGQFTPAGISPGAPRNVKVGNHGSLQLNGTDQTIADLDLFEGGVTTVALGKPTGLLTVRGHIRAHIGAPVESRVQLFTGLSMLLGKFHVAGSSDTQDLAADAGTILWISGPVSDSSVSVLRKTGPGTLMLTGNSTFAARLDLEEGATRVSGENPLGSPIQPTRVLAGATLVTENLTTTEPLELSGFGFDQLGALFATSTNQFNGPIVLSAAASIHVHEGDFTRIQGAISGPGGFAKIGKGTLRIAGSTPNTFTGPAQVREGLLELAKTSGVAIPSRLMVEDVVSNTHHTARWLAAAQVADAAAVTSDTKGTLDLNGFSETIGSLNGTGAVLLGNGKLVVGNDNTSTTYGGLISGVGGSIQKVGNGTLILTADNTYTGPTTVTGGLLRVDGSQADSNVSVNTGGRLGGNGHVGNLTISTGSVLPGSSPGILRMNAVNLSSPAAIAAIEINGTAPGAGHDQLVFRAAPISLGGTLQLSMNFTGAPGNLYTIGRNDTAAPITTPFTGLPEGQVFDVGSSRFSITYKGGDGNDVVLKQLDPAAPVQFAGNRVLPDGSVEFKGFALPDQDAVIEVTDQLVPPIQWQRHSVVRGGADGSILFVDRETGRQTARFYRITTP
jgi:autotransporter-associated beta strand protein